MWNTYDDDEDLVTRVKRETAQLLGFAIDDGWMEPYGELDDDEGTVEPEEGDRQDEEGGGFPQ